LDVQDKESLTGFSFFISTFSLDVVVSWLGDLSFDGSVIGVALDTCGETSENPDQWSDGVLDCEWNSKALSDSEDQVSWIFNDESDDCSG
jgi:hypothetical protein